MHPESFAVLITSYVSISVQRSWSCWPKLGIDSSPSKTHREKRVFLFSVESLNHVDASEFNARFCHTSSTPALSWQWISSWSLSRRRRPCAISWLELRPFDHAQTSGRKKSWHLYFLKNTFASSSTVLTKAVTETPWPNSEVQGCYDYNMDVTHSCWN